MNKELILEFEKEFEKMKQELGFDSSLEDLDKIFFIKDKISEEGFVSSRLDRQICGRIVETYMNWATYLHSLILPNPQNILNLSEAKVFDSEEKKEINDLMKEAMKMGSKNTWIGLTKDKSEEAKFIDEALNKWKNNFEPKLIKIIEKIKEEWSK